MQMKLVTSLLKLGISKCIYVTSLLLSTIGAEVVVFVNTRMLLTANCFFDLFSVRELIINVTLTLSEDLV
jgi:hypothetical protein